MNPLNWLAALVVRGDITEWPYRIQLVALGVFALAGIGWSLKHPLWRKTFAVACFLVCLAVVVQVAVIVALCHLGTPSC